MYFLVLVCFLVSCLFVCLFLYHFILFRLRCIVLYLNLGNTRPHIINYKTRKNHKYIYNLQNQYYISWKYVVKINLFSKEQVLITTICYNEFTSYANRSSTLVYKKKITLVCSMEIINTWIFSSNWFEEFM